MQSVHVYSCHISYQYPRDCTAMQIGPLPAKRSLHLCLFRTILNASPPVVHVVLVYPVSSNIWLNPFRAEESAFQWNLAIHAVLNGAKNGVHFQAIQLIQFTRNGNRGMSTWVQLPGPRWVAAPKVDNWWNSIGIFIHPIHRINRPKIMQTSK